MQQEAATMIRRSLLCLVLLVCAHSNCCHGLAKSAFPSSIHFKAAVLTHAEPFAVRNEFSGEYSGLQIDLLERLKVFALEDGVELTVELEEAPMFAYVQMLDRLSDNCNTTENPQPLEECGRYDLLIGDFYTNPDRSLGVDFTPPFLRTAVSALQYVFRDTTQWRNEITTLEEAQNSNASICVVDGSYMDAIARKKYPDAHYHRCEDPQDCILQLKASVCPLFVDDELQLRYRAVQDPTLQVTQEDFNSQFISWPMSSSLPLASRKLLERWMYAAKSNATLDELYNEYFSVNLCPVGYSGAQCDQPCHAQHGRSDRTGQCVCESTKWTGDSCSIEVLENTNGIPQALVYIGYVMVGINVTAALICFIWLFVNRSSPQVQVAQPSFLLLVLVGCLISTFTILPLAQENLTMIEDDDDANDAWCMVIPWTYSVGFSITFGSLFAKIQRVYTLFKSAVSTRRIAVSWKDTLSIIGGVLLLDVAVLTAWTVLDPLHWDRTILTTDKYGDPLSSEGYCTSDHWHIFASIIALLHFGLMGFACYLCYVSRDIPTKFSEGRYLAIAMISNLQIFVVGVPILIILGNDPQSSFFVRSVIIWMNDLVVMALIFGNLMYSFWMDRQSGVDSKVAIRSAFERYTSRVQAKSSMEPQQQSHGTKLSNISEGVSQERESSKRDSPKKSRERSLTKSKSREDDKPLRVSRKSKSGQRERPPDSWAAINLVNSEFDRDESGDSITEAPSCSFREPSAPLALPQITEESQVEHDALGESSTRRSSLLRASNLPKNTVPRFDYASSRIHRVRESYASEVEAESPGDEAFQDEGSNKV